MKNKQNSGAIFVLMLFLWFPKPLICQDADPPNIILINVDDLGWRDLSVYGSFVYQTPNVEKLATRGMLFTNAYASAANCAPSRASMMTGLQTSRHGIFTVASSERGESKTRKLIPIQNTRVLADSFETIAEILSSEGYITATMGKWHLGPDPLTQGFRVNIGGTNRGAPQTYFSPYQNPALEDGLEGEYLTDRLTSDAISFLQQNSNKKFFLYLPFFAIHTPLMARPDLLAKYEEVDMPEGQENPVYAAMVEAVDENIGRLLEVIEEQGLEENTVIIFTSDNGGIASQSSQAPLRAGKGSYYEGGIRVPLIICWKNHIPPSTISDEPVTNLDFLPTIADLVGARLPAREMDGQSLASLLLNDESMQARPLYWHFPIYLEAYNGQFDQARDTLFRTRPGTIMRFGPWKLHEYFEDGALELYHLLLDPGERNNLAAIYPDQMKYLHGMMQQWRYDLGAPVPDQFNVEYQSPHD